LTLRPSPILKIFVSRLATWEHQPKDPYQYAPARRRGEPFRAIVYSELPVRY
jgi:hypothetical protein